METFKKTFRRIIAMAIVIIMLVSAAPLDGFVNTDWSDFAIVAKAEEISIVSIDVPDVEVIENYDGSKEEYVDEETGEASVWFRYAPVIWGVPGITVTLSDGRSKTGTCWEIEEEFGISIGCYDDQSFDNQWGIGEHTAYVTCEGYTGEFTVNVIENPIESFSVEPLSFIEFTNGWINTGVSTDEETGEETPWEYYHYQIYYYDLHYTVQLSNGGTVEGNGYEVTEYFDDVALNVDGQQDYDCQWLAGNTYTVNIGILGVYAPLTVSIVENPIERIEIDDMSFMEYTNGDYVDKEWDEENDTWVDVDYFSYYREPQKITVYYKDGREPEVYDSLWRFSEETGLEYSLSDTQSADSPWGVGEHTVTLQAGKYTEEYTVTITEHLIKEFSVEPIELIEQVNGFWDSGTYWDDEEECEVPYNYFRYEFGYSKMMFTVELADGTVITGDGSYIGEYFESYPEVNSNQDYANIWETGENTYEIRLLGKRIFAVANVIENPIESIEIEDIILEEGSDGELLWDENYYEDTDEWIYEEAFKYPSDPRNMTVTFKSGDVKEYESIHDFIYENDLGYTIYDGQNKANEWGIGEHTVVLKIGKFETSYTVTVNKNPIERIEISSVKLIDGIDNFEYEDWIYDSETEEECLVTWMRYGLGRPASVTVYYNDGRVEELNEDEIDMECSVSSDQSYYNQWEAGNTYTARLTYKNFTAEYTVIIEENPVERIEIADTVLRENMDGEMSSDWYYDEETDTEVYKEYFRYNAEPDSLTVYFRDGDIKTYEYPYEFYEDTGIDYVIEDGQSYRNPWGPGEHTVEFIAGGVATEYTITVIEDPIESIVMEPVSIVEYTNGYMADDGYWDENENWVDVTYFQYYIPQKKVTVNYKDGTSKVYNNIYMLEEDLEISCRYDDGQSAGAPWGVGVHEVTYRIGSHECILEVEITEAPIAEIEIPTVHICEGKNGYTSTGTYTDETTGEEIPYSYYYYYVDSIDFDIKVTLKDGTVVETSLYEFGDLFGIWPDVITDQSYENPWVNGNEYTATLIAFGKRIEFDVEFCSHANSTYYSELLPTCIFEGYEAGKYCSDCTTWYEGREYIPVISHTDKNSDGNCDICLQSIEYIENSSMLGKFLFLTDRPFDETQKAPDYTVFLYLWWSNQFDEYYDKEEYIYTVPYEVYMATADKCFANHSDMKEYFRNNEMFTDETEQTVRWYDGGFGDARSLEYMSVYDHGNGKQTLQGIEISFGYEPEYYEGRDDCYITDYQYRDIFGKIETGKSYGIIEGAYELTVQKTADGTKILSLLPSDRYLLDGHLYEFIEDEPTAKYDSFDIVCGDEVTVTSNDGLLTDCLHKFERFNGYWYTHGTGFGFDIELEDGYELVKVILKDNNGERALDEMSFGGYSIIPDGNVTLTVLTEKPENHTHSYTAKITKPATCGATGIRTYTCSCGDSYTEKINATGKHTGGTATCKTKAKCSVCGAYYGSVNVSNHKNIVTIPAVAATYTKTGLTAGKKCADCGKITVAQKTVSKLTLSKVDGLRAKDIKVAKASEIKLSWNKVSGAEKYEVYIKNGSKWTKLTSTSKTSYTVKKDGKKKNLKADREYQFRVRAVVDGASGAYSSVLKVETIPETTSKLTLKAGNKQLTASWSKVSGISGYEILYSTSKKFTKKTTQTVSAKSSSKKTTIKKLTKGKKYYVRIRTYKTVDGKKVYSDRSAVKSVKVK